MSFALPINKHHFHLVNIPIKKRRETRERKEKEKQKRVRSKYNSTPNFKWYF
ncbi:unnamed protein product [Prunus brigantina]